ncbi:MAG: phosphatidylserine synthase [Hyphomicrobiales bacterium]|nr:phosphatidylserine synthase [Hyphomicrobiales bacterium]
MVALAGALTGFAPTIARGPLDGEPMIAGVRVFYGPGDNLQDIDRTLIAGARETLDMAAYVLTDRAVIDALGEAARRGVRVRLYLDPDQPALRSRGAGGAALEALGRAPNVQVRVKAGEDLMHLKAYQVDRRVLRTGSANFSVSGARRQDNDIVLIQSREAVARFLREFDALWARPGGPMRPGQKPFGVSRAEDERP